MNDVIGMTATATKAVGAGGEFVADAAPYVAAPISVGFLANGIRTRNSDQILNGSYGLLTLGVAAFVSAPVAVGMALGKLGFDAAGLGDPDQYDPNILEEAALCQ